MASAVGRRLTICATSWPSLPRGTILWNRRASGKSEPTAPSPQAKGPILLIENDRATELAGTFLPARAALDRSCVSLAGLGCDVHSKYADVVSAESPFMCCDGYGPMKVVLLRIGIDTGSGGIHGPLFSDGTFEYIPIPDGHDTDERTYGKVVGRHRRKLIDYFPASMQNRMAEQSMHVDPEFGSFTYGDPTTPKAGLRHLQAGDLLVFYCGLQGWDFVSAPALYLMGFFEVEESR